MDPNECLAELRDYIQSEKTLSENGDAWEYVDEIIDRFEALDDWLSKGGFLPSAWRSMNRQFADNEFYGGKDV